MISAYKYDWMVHNACILTIDELLRVCEERVNCLLKMLLINPLQRVAVRRPGFKPEI